MLERKKLKGRAQITFVLPDHTPDGPVSVVGDYWFDDDHADGHDGANSRLHTRPAARTSGGWRARSHGAGVRTVGPARC
ncbi:hypothetical protein AB0F11_24755 [Streptomyces sp. NPDC032472]|uniref:hypothetical protein n=1 Tax=Streptomyces sp. NPDC032472 TaxID=3155018 RepID=UPI0033E78A97